MKFSIRQILASAAGAVIAAIIASTFGVKGTIIGVAIGSAAATFATALVAQSIERGQQAVKQVVVRAPDSSPLLRKLGGTGTTSAPGGPEDASPGSTQATATPAAGAIGMEPPAAADGADRLEIPAARDASAAPGLDGTQASGQFGSASSPRTFSWTTIAGTAAVVFVIALLFITAIELISGKPLAAIFGNAGSGPTVKNIFTPSPSPAPTTTTTTPSTTSTTTSSTATTGTSTTTSTTAPTNTTTTIAPGAATTTTTAPAGAARSTTTASTGVPSR